MNKRQRKKQFVREFSRLYDESLKHKDFKLNMAISTFKDKRGTSRMFLTLNKSMDGRFSYGELPEISFDGYCLSWKTLKE